MVFLCLGGKDVKRSFFGFSFPLFLASLFLCEIPSLFIGNKICLFPLNCLVIKQPRFTLIPFFFLFTFGPLVHLLYFLFSYF